MRFSSIIISIIFLINSCSNRNKIYYSKTDNNLNLFINNKLVKSYLINDYKIYSYVYNKESINNDCVLIESIIDDEIFNRKIFNSIDIKILNDLFDNYIKFSENLFITDSIYRNLILTYIKKTQFAFLEESYKQFIFTSYDTSNYFYYLQYLKGYNSSLYMNNKIECIAIQQSKLYQRISNPKKNEIIFILIKDINYNKNYNRIKFNNQELVFSIKYYIKKDKISFTKECLNAWLLLTNYYKHERSY